MEVAERVGREPDAEFEVQRGTDSETIEVRPKDVTYGHTGKMLSQFTMVTRPMVSFNFNKFHSGLPPWNALLSFTLYGDEIAEFDAAEHEETRVTGNLKTVDVVASSIEFRKNDFQVK